MEVVRAALATEQEVERELDMGRGLGGIIQRAQHLGGDKSIFILVPAAIRRSDMRGKGAAGTLLRQQLRQRQWHKRCRFARFAWQDFEMRVLRAERAADAVIALAIAGKADDVVLQWNLFAHRAVKQRHGLAIGRQQRGDTVENAAVVAEKLAAMANSVKLSRLPSGAYPRLNP